MIGLTMFLFGRIWTLVLWVMKAVVCFKYFLMGYPIRNVEDNGAKSYMNGPELTQGVSEKNGSMLLR